MGATCGAVACPAAPAAHPCLLDFITCIGALWTTASGCHLGSVGGPGLLSSCLSSRAKGLTHLPLRDRSGMVGSLKDAAGPRPLPHAPLQTPGMLHGIMIALRNLTARWTPARCCLQNTISGTIASLTPNHNTAARVSLIPRNSSNG